MSFYKYGIDQYESELMAKLVQTQNNLTALRFEHWHKYELYSINWWLLILIVLTSWVIWLRLVDKRQIKDCLLVGLSIGLMSLIVDYIGGEKLFWVYPVTIYPLLPRLLEIDLAALPVSYMLIYQYYPKWKAYIIALIILGTMLSFVAEPLYHLSDGYQPLVWKYYYSLPIYIIMGVFIKWFIIKLRLIEQR